MKKNTKIIVLLTILTPIIFFTGFQSCKKEATKSSSSDKINPSSSNALSKVLIVPSDGIRKTGSPPPPSSGSSAPTIVFADPTVSYCSGGVIRLPIAFQNNSGNGIGGIYFQVDGASEYFQIPSYSSSSSGTLVLPIGIPKNVLNGKFCITISIFDQAGNVSQQFKTCVTVTSPIACGTQLNSGGEGVTSTIHKMGNTAGVVIIDYETYTVPDRIDIFYNGVWVAGTGPNPGPSGAIPPLANCSNPTAGYIGGNGKFCFNYDPETDGDEVEVVVSGCVRGGTAWKYSIGCASPNDECLAGQDGDPRFSLKFDQPVDFDLHVKDPSGEEIYFARRTSVSGGKLDKDCINKPGYENIYWESGSAPSGNFEYWVKFYGKGSASSSNYILTITKNGNVLSTKSGSLTTVGSESPHYTHYQQ
ncbi:MAG: YfaP family protein [Bacteroidia bacterium]